jgi:hypothetical protein
MDGIGRVMSFVHDGVLKMSLLWHTKSFLEPQSPILIHSKVWGFVFSRLGLNLPQLLTILLGFHDLVV